MHFYHNLVTEKSWKLLVDLRKKYDFILIGGWAVFLYTKALKSKDVDLVLEYEQLDKLKEEFEISKNNRLKKYEAKRNGLEIDIYIPFYSNPGLPAEVLKNFTTGIEGFRVVEKEILVVLKQKALIERARSVKGRKDLIDLISLFALDDFDWTSYKKILIQFNLKEHSEFTKEIIAQTREIEELGLNVHKMARFKKKVLPLI